MNKEIKDFIASNKLSDEDILRLLKDESSDANKDQDDTDQEDTADTDSADGQEEDQNVEKDATEEQPDMRAMIKEILAEELKAMKGGKPAPKPKGKPKVEPIPKYKEFGEL